MTKEATSVTELTAPAMHNQCLRKARFRTFSAADKRAKKFNFVSPPPPGYRFHVYSCPVCFGWHVGRTKVSHHAPTQKPDTTVSA